MIFYFYNIVLPLLLACVSKIIPLKLRFIWFCFSVSMFSILLASRSFGNDTQAYVSIFDDISSTESFSHLFNYNLDIGFSILVKLLSIISGDSIFLFSSISIISITVLSLSHPDFVINKSFVTFLLLMLFCAGYYTEAIRVGLAMSVVMIYFKTSRTVIRIVSFVMAASFHASSILVLIGSFFKLDKFPILSAIITALTFYLAIPYFYHINYKIYWYVTEGGGNFSLVAFAYALIFVFYLKVSTHFIDYANRSKIASSALFAFSSSIGFSMYSEIISSRIYEMGCFLFVLIIIYDGIYSKFTAMSVARKSLLYLLVLSFLMLYLRVYFIRFNY